MGSSACVYFGVVVEISLAPTEIKINKRICPNESCKNNKRDNRSKFCEKCGSEIKDITIVTPGHRVVDFETFDEIGLPEDLFMNYDISSGDESIQWFILNYKTEGVLFGHIDIDYNEDRDVIDDYENIIKSVSIIKEKYGPHFDDAKHKGLIKDYKITYKLLTYYW